MEELDIMIINTTHFTSKNNGKTYNTIHFILCGKEDYIKTDKFDGYSIAECFINQNIIGQVPIMQKIKGQFVTTKRGLTKQLNLEKLVTPNGTINLV